MKYLIRLDDACETMNLEKWLVMESLLDKYNIRPLVAVIPNNEDPLQIIDKPNKKFWNWLKILEGKGWEIGLHGNNHVYQTKEGGINPIHKRSEFAGVPLIEQENKIKSGIDKFKAMNLNPKIFVAPSHTFDLNTLKALNNQSSIRIISDTIALNPYKEHGFVFIPQQLGAVRKTFLNGIYTFCYHPNTMSNKDFKKLENFLFRKNKDFISFKDLKLKNIKSKSVLDKIISNFYFKFRFYFR